MKVFKNLRAFFCVILFTSLFVNTTQAFDMEHQRLNIEFILRDGENTVVSIVKTFSYSFSRNVESTDSIAAYDKPCFFVLGYDVVDINVLKLLNQQNPNLNAEVNITDSYGVYPPRKILLKAITLDGLNDQLSPEYSSFYMNLSCMKLVVDGVEIKNL